jgi:hypothetical protein
LTKWYLVVVDGVVVDVVVVDVVVFLVVVVVVVVDVEVLLLCFHFFFSLPFSLAKNKLERWQRSSLFFERVRERERKRILAMWYLDVVDVVVVVDVKVLLLCHHFYFSLSFSIWRIR